MPIIAEVRGQPHVVGSGGGRVEIGEELGWKSEVSGSSRVRVDYSAAPGRVIVNVVVVDEGVVRVHIVD